MSATQLLNSIMMMGIHTHTVSQPVVVLERLNENDNDSLQIKIENTRSLKTPPMLTPKLEQEESPSEQGSCRSLRSHVENTNGAIKRRFSESSSVTDIEDNKPLKFFRNKTNHNIQNNMSVKAPPTCTSTKAKRVSLRQIKLRKNKEAKERQREKKNMALTKITKIKKARKKERSSVRETRVLGGSVPHTRARHEATASPAPSFSGVVDHTSFDTSLLIPINTRNKVKLTKATQFKKPRPRQRSRLHGTSDKTRAELERAQLNIILEKTHAEPDRAGPKIIGEKTRAELDRAQLNIIPEKTHAEPERAGPKIIGEKTRAEPDRAQLNIIPEKTHAEPERAGPKIISEKTCADPDRAQLNIISEKTHAEPERTQLNIISEKTRAEPEREGPKIIDEKTCAEPDRVQLNFISEKTHAEPERTQLNIISEKTCAEPEKAQLNIISEKTRAEPERAQLNIISEKTHAEPERARLNIIGEKTRAEPKRSRRDVIGDKTRAEPERAQLNFISEKTRAEPKRARRDVNGDKTRAEPERAQLNIISEKTRAEPKRARRDVIGDKRRSEPERAQLNIFSEKTRAEPVRGQLDIISEKTRAEPKRARRDVIGDKTQAEPERAQLNIISEKTRAEPKIARRDVTGDTTQAEPERAQLNINSEKTRAEPKRARRNVLGDTTQAESERAQLNIFSKKTRAEPERAQLNINSEKTRAEPKRARRNVLGDTTQAESERAQLNIFSEKTRAEPEKAQLNNISEKTRAEPKRARRDVIGDKTQAEPERAQLNIISEKTRAEPKIARRDVTGDTTQAEPERAQLNINSEKTRAEPKRARRNVLGDTTQAEPERAQLNIFSKKTRAEPERAQLNINSEKTRAEPERAQLNINSEKTRAEPKRARRDVIGDKTQAELERCEYGYCGSFDSGSLLSSVIAMGDTEQMSDDLERVVADFVERAQRSPSARPTSCIHTCSHDQLSRANEIANANQKPNKLDIMVSSSLTTEELLNELELMDVNTAHVSSPARPPSPSPGAAPDVYTFNEENEVEAGPSPFRARRSRQILRSSFYPPRSVSMDPALTNRKRDTNYVIRFLDLQKQILIAYAQSNVESKVKKIHVERMVNILSRYTTEMLLPKRDKNRPVETVVIDDDDDDPKQEPEEPPADEREEVPPLASGSGSGDEITLDDDTDIPRAPLPSERQSADDDDDGPEISEAPAFYPTKEEMRDLNSYVEKIEPVARKYGIFKIVPPRDFQPPCQLRNVQFKSTNQYVSSMYSRWGPAASEMTAIKAHLATQNVAFTRPPLFEGVEVDLVKLYQLVQEHGGLIRVMEERKWAAIAETMQLNARAGRVKAAVKLDKIYMKHLLPYETLSEEERKELRARVTVAWRTRYERQRARASRPLHRQRRLLGESESSGEDEEPEPAELATAFLEVEDCVVPGPNMNLARFRRVGERVRDMRFPGASTDEPPHWAAVERAYWRIVRTGTEHICVHGAALDTSQDALGFPAAIDAPYGNHPWNLKRLGESDNNVLSSLGPTLAVTVPTLHLGMMFSTNCWHHDPHHLPWTEYMHQGPPKIWYGIADSESGKFRAAAEQLVPTAVQRKALWLPSDTAMLPPRLLAARGVRLVRALQAPGEYVVVLPRAYSCSISTGLTVSESLYFAGETWLDGVNKVFAALRADAEPSMFALEALLEGVVQRPSAPVPRLLRARALLRPLLLAERDRRREAATLGVRALSPHEFLKENRRCTKTSWQVARDECHVCRATLHWSKIVDVSARVSVCLEHGLHLVRARNPSAAFTTILFYSDHQISQLVADLNKPIKTP